MTTIHKSPVITPVVRSNGSMWVLLAGGPEQRKIAFGRTLKKAAETFERLYQLKVRLPFRYRGFDHLTPDDFNATVGQTGG